MNFSSAAWSCTNSTSASPRRPMSSAWPVPRATTRASMPVAALKAGSRWLNRPDCSVLDMGRRGDADVLFVHDQAAEEKFIAEGWGLKRLPVMYNDFVLIGPANDPAGLRGQDIVAALRRLAAGPAPFISRGDKSGTHAAELRYWKAAGTDIAAARPAGYKECGCGMGPALNIAASTGAYVLADRGTWLSFKNRADLQVLVEGDSRLFNQYGVIVVNPARHPHVKQALAQQFADWVTSAPGQAVIASYKIGGQQLFFPNAGK